MEMMFQNTESLEPRAETEQEKQERLISFRAELSELKEEDGEKEQSRRNPHLSEMDPDGLADEERHWYELFKGIDFSSEDAIKEYTVIATEFFRMKEDFSRKKEEEFLSQRESGSQPTPEEIMEFMARDPRHNFYMWMANNVTGALLKKRAVIKKFQRSVDLNQDAA
jgi:hypothetical protein